MGEDSVFKTSLFLAGPDGSDPFCCRGEAASALISKVPGLAGHVQSRTAEQQVDPNTSSPFTGVAELWFADLSAAAAADAAMPDDLLTPDTHVAASVVGMMRTVMRKPAFYDARAEDALVKGVFPFRCQEALGAAAFQKYWWQTHGPLAAQTEGALCYTQCHPPLAAYQQEKPPFDGITELYWPDVAAARAAMSSRQMIEEQAVDSRNFAEPGSVILFLATEEVVLAG